MSDRSGGLVSVGERTVAWRAGLTLADVALELGIPQEYPLAKIDGKFVWKKDWPATDVPDGAKIRFHPIIGGG